MATKAFQKIYTKITQITKATCSLKATGVGYDELATVNGKLAQVVKIAGDEVTLQVFEGTEGIPTNAEVVFLGKAPTIKVSEQLAGRFFNAFGDPIDGGPAIEGEEVEIGGPSVNPVRRKQPSELIATGIAGIDLNNTLVSGQKIPFFADPDQPFNQVMANVALRAETDKIILGGMGMTNDDYLYFKNVFSNAGALDRIVSFMNTTENPPVERLLIPDMALTAAEYFAVNNNEKVLVLLTEEHSAAAYKMGLRPDATVYTLLTWAVLWACSAGCRRFRSRCSLLRGIPSDCIWHIRWCCACGTNGRHGSRRLLICGCGRCLRLRLRADWRLRSYCLICRSASIWAAQNVERKSCKGEHNGKKENRRTKSI